MIISIKVRLIPTQEQETMFWKSTGTSRYIYNWALDRQINNYKDGNKFILDGALRKEITQIKKLEEYKWLSEVSCDIPKQAIKDLCRAYKNFFTGKANKPKFKSRKKSTPSFYNDTHKLKVDYDKVYLSNIGWVKLSELNRIPINVKYTNPRITYDNKYWYISVGIEVEKPNTKLNDTSLGIDLGIKDLAIVSDVSKYKNINKTKEVKRLKKKLRRVQRKVSRKYEMNKKITKKGISYNKTNNIIKLEKHIKLIYRKLKNIRLNNIHQITNKIVKTKPSKIVIEDLNVKGMMKNKHLSKAIAEQCFNTFKNILTYKSNFYGIDIIIADRFYPSSKTCSKCGNIKKDLKLSDRVYKCECGFELDRDLNAAINLSKLA